MISFSNRTEIVGSGTTPVNPGEPAGTLPGMFMLAVALSDIAGAITEPAGWSRLCSVIGGVSMCTVYYLIRGQVAPSYAWTMTGTVYREVMIAAFRATDAQAIIDALSAAGTYRAASTNIPDPPSVAMRSPSGMAICVGFSNGSNGTWACLGYLSATASAAATDVGIFYKQLVAAGSEDPPLWTGSVAANDEWDGLTLALTDVFQIVPTVTSSPAYIRKRMPLQQRIANS